MKPHGLILAGGNATRLGGGDKPLRPLAGLVLLDHVTARLRGQVAALALSANGDPARFAAWGLPVLPDATAGQGPLAGILAGLRWAAASGATHLLTVPGDTPFLPHDLAERLGVAPAGIAHAVSNGRHHYAVALIPTVRAASLAAALADGTRAIRHWMHGSVAVAFPTQGGDPFTNINTQADLAQAEARLRTSRW